MDEQKYQNLRRGEKGAIVSIIAYAGLSLLKIIVGLFSGSGALLADGWNNVTDIVASLAVFIGLRIARKPADEDHHYGHWKSETIASMVASFVMMAVGLQVLFESARTLFRPEQTVPDAYAAYVGLFAAGVMYLVYRFNKRLANEVKSQALMAAAKDNRSDAWVSLGAVAGIIGAQGGMTWVDTVAAFIVGLLICKTAWGIFRESSHELSDGFDEKKMVRYRKVVKGVEGVKGIQSMKGRMYGNNEVIDVVILVRATLTVDEAHDVATAVEDILMQSCGVYDVHVHVEPDTCQIHRRERRETPRKRP